MDDSNVIINGTVSVWLRLKKGKFNKSLLIMMVGCSRRGGSCKLHSSVGSRKHWSGKQFKVRTLNNTCKGYGIITWHVHYCYNSVLQSFEDVLSRYAQQLSLNQNQTITAPSLVIVAELVCPLATLHLYNYNYYHNYFFVHCREIVRLLLMKDEPSLQVKIALQNTVM